MSGSFFYQIDFVSLTDKISCHEVITLYSHSHFNKHIDRILRLQTWRGTPETVQQKQLGLLSKTWKISEVYLDNVSQTSAWTNFTLKVEGSGSDTITYKYTCTNRSTSVLGPWPASGKWMFGDLPVSQIIRDPIRHRLT